jgi:hypothetical protein
MFIFKKTEAYLTQRSQRIEYQPTHLFMWTDIQKIDHTILHIANGQNKVLFDF